MKRKALLAAAAVGIAAVIGLENTGPVYRDCEVYQGYTLEPNDGIVHYAFDPKNVYNRAGSPRYSLEGDPELINSLRIGESYCFEFKETIFSNKLKSVSLEN